MTGRYKAYPEYKESGVDWIGEIPKNWVYLPLKRNFKIVNGSTPKSVEASYWDGEITWVTPADLSKIKGEIQNSSKNITIEGLNSCGTSLVPKGSLILSTRAPIGTVAISSKKLCTNQGCKSLINTTDTENKFYYYVLSVSGKQLNNLGRGTTFLELSTDELANYAVPMPLLSEQQKIANFLDHETAKIDTLITKQEKLIELLKEKRQAVISHAVTKGLNPDAPMKDSGVEWLGKVPEHWEVMRLKHLIKSLESGCSVNAADVPAKDNELGVLKTSCVYTRRFRASENKTVVVEELSRVKCAVRKGAIIISRMNTPELVGASALVDTKASNLFLPDRLWQTIFDERFEVNSEFLAHFMTVEGFRNQISLSAEGASSSMQNIAKEDYLSINVLLPKREEQTQIVSYIKESEAKFLRLETKALNAIQLMKERKTALISAAVTGKIDVRDWAILDKDQG